MRLPALSSSLLLATLLAFGAHAQAPRYVSLVNHANHSVVSLDVTAQGEGDYRGVPLDEPLRGGGESLTVALHGQGCRYDLRFGFADGRTLRYEDVDVCRYGKVSIRPLPRGAAGQTYVVRATVQAAYAETEAGSASSVSP